MLHTDDKVRPENRRLACRKRRDLGFQTGLAPRAMRLPLIILSTPPTRPRGITLGTLLVELNTRMSRP